MPFAQELKAISYIYILKKTYLNFWFRWMPTKNGVAEQ